MNTAETPSILASERVIRPRHGLVAVDFGELWRYRELFVFLAWRDILVRYKQTYIGFAWALLQPLMMTVVSTFVFGRIAKMPSGNVPYSMMIYTALLPWLFFANTMTRSSNSLVTSANMISKVYFPRLIIPASAVLGGVVDFGVGLLILAAMMMIFHIQVTLMLLLLPLFFLMALLAAFSMGLWLSALNVKYRDVGYLVPFMVQIGAYVSPVFYMTGMVPEKWRFWYTLNPLCGVIDGFRWCVLGPAFEPYWPGFFAGLTLVLVLLVTGAIHFRSTEKTFADVI